MQKMRVSPLSLVLGALLGAAATLAVGALPEATAGAPAETAEVPLERRAVHDALDLVLDRYVERVDAEALLARGLKHMVSGLDPYSHYLTAQERARADKLVRQGADAGLITVLDLDAAGGPNLEISAVHPDSPAARLGLAPGDRIVSLRGRASASLLSRAEAQLLLAGAPGERIELEVDRGQGRERLALTLAAPNDAALVEGELLTEKGAKTAVLAIHGFRAGTGEQVKRTLAELRRRAGGRLAGIVLDLRGNPGGEVDEAVLVADLFVERGVLTRTRGRGGAIAREERATVAGTDAETPLVILQDHRSASAAELLAAALHDHDRARIVGERSFGKGSVQARIAIADGSLLTLTVARYFSPDDRSIDGRGVEPDVTVRDAAAATALEAAQRELERLRAGGA